ncbi:hypothetical protein WMY93_001031 [Mugilogobius chulae]|uniref:Uncharacterized protein n=1 Tax=Mugilogobius chulae TaxID=88201 RepID=A0AAW0Q974_9GOBI
MRSLSEQLQQMRTQTEDAVSVGAAAADAHTDGGVSLLRRATGGGLGGVMSMANLPLPPGSKYHHINAETLVIENSSGSNRKEVEEISTVQEQSTPQLCSTSQQSLRTCPKLCTSLCLRLPNRKSPRQVSQTSLPDKSPSQSPSHHRSDGQN